MADPTRSIELTGEYDLSRQEELRLLLDPILDGPITLDLRAVRYVDSIFLAQLIKLRRRVSDVSLSGCHANVRKILAIAGLDHLFNLVD